MSARIQAWILAVVSVAVWLVLWAWVPLPGVDVSALTFALGAEEMVTVGGMSLVGLVLWRALADVLGTSPRAGRIARLGALALFVLGWAWTGWMLALSLEAVVWQVVVPVPGVRFRLVLALTLAAAAALAWFISERLDAVGLDGAVFLALPVFFGDLWAWHGDRLHELTLGAMSPAYVLASPLLPLGAVAVLLAVRPPRYPVQVVGALVVRTPVPLLLVPYLVLALAADGLDVVSAGEDVATLFRTLLSWGSVAAVAALLWSRPTGSGAVRRALYWTLVGLAWLVPLGLVGTWAAQLALSQPRFDGEAVVEVQATYEGPVTELDLDKLRDRLQGVGDERQVSAAGNRVRIVLVGIDPVEAVPWLDEVGTRGGRFTVHPVAQTRWTEIRRRLRDADDPGDPSTWPPAPEGLIWGPEPCDDSPACRVYLLEPPILEGRHLAEVAGTVDVRTGGGAVYLEFTSEGRDVFGAWTTDHVDEQMALVLDGSVLSAPVINEPITGGRARISLGAASDPEGTLAEARDLAEAMRGGGLDAGKRLSFEVVREGELR